MGTAFEDELDQLVTKFRLGGVTMPDDTLVFHDADNKPLRPNTVTRAWTTLAARAGLKPIRLHDARHTHASLLLRQNVHPKIVQERLGHSSIEMTLDLYSHVAPGLQELAAVRFDQLLNGTIPSVVSAER